MLGYKVDTATTISTAHDGTSTEADDPGLLVEPTDRCPRQLVPWDADRCPTPFLEVLVHRLDPLPGLLALCAGYERGKWRCERLAQHLIEWLPEFALSDSELRGFDPGNGVQLIRKAAALIYNTDKYKRRGEFGELLLHAVIRQCFNTCRAISKIYYKDSANDTVKGFDAVHVVARDEWLELWLGEVKFYKDLSKAITDVVAELKAHTQTDYLRTEFALITNKIEDGWSHADKLKKLLHPNTSLDEVFRAACIPVLLTYDSKTVAAFDRTCAAYVEAFEREVGEAHARFAYSELPRKLEIHLFLLPLHSKEELQTRLDGKLKTWQNL